MALSRRRFLARAVSLGLVVGTLPSADLLALMQDPTGPRQDLGEPWRRGVQTGVLDFQMEPTTTLDTLFGTGLDTRLYTDLSGLEPSSPLARTDNFFVRTGVPDGLDLARPWSVRVDGLADRPLALSIDELEPWVRDLGLHVVECAGNSRFTRFGLISAARWSGVPVMELIERSGPRSATVRISGSDEHSEGSTNSTIGCSWIFDLDTLAAAGAFLATEMNGAPLTPEHGAPVRLVVPGWYGCCSIKWLERIELVNAEQPATSQMIEFAERTHQGGVPDRAADYRPPIIDTTALPVRVEVWHIVDQIEYRVVGILWGGSGGTDRLAIRFSPQEPYQLVTEQPVSPEPGSWGLWSHRWRPPGSGRYLIQLAVDDPAIPTRRLDMGYYARAVEL